MKDWIPVATVGLGLAGLMLALHAQTQRQFADVRSDIAQLDERLTARIESLDQRVYELNERLTRVETRVLEAVQP